MRHREFRIGRDRRRSNSLSAACVLPVRSRRSRYARPFQYAICAASLLVVGAAGATALADGVWSAIASASAVASCVCSANRSPVRPFHRFAPRHRGVRPLEVQRHAQAIARPICTDPVTT